MISKRYFPPELLYDFLKIENDQINSEILGHSVNGLPIYKLRIGNGKQKIFMWSQMHGNETTTTKAILDLIPWLLDPFRSDTLDLFTFHIIPQLNPDGAKAYTRLNANQFDLNRDSIKLSQPESKLLRVEYDRIKPDYALNLHGQRTIYGAGVNGGPATLSFLSPSANPERSITPARRIAMSAIASIYNSIRDELPLGIGRYDDTFNPNCVGDSFSKAGTPTILFEAGHYPEDYQREVSRNFVFKALKALINHLEENNTTYDTADYFKIPENINSYVDLIVSNIDISFNDEIFKNQQLAIQFEESLKGGEVVFLPSLNDFSINLSQKAHRYIKLPDNYFKKPIPFKQDKILINHKFDKLFSVKP